MSDIPHWERTITALCTELEQCRILLNAANQRADTEKKRADEAEAFMRNFIALAPFAQSKVTVLDWREVQSNKVTQLPPRRPVDLWPSARRRPDAGPNRVPRQRSAREMD